MMAPCREVDRWPLAGVDGCSRAGRWPHAPAQGGGPSPASSRRVKFLDGVAGRRGWPKTVPSDPEPTKQALRPAYRLQAWFLKDKTRMSDALPPAPGWDEQFVDRRILPDRRARPTTVW